MVCHWAIQREQNKDQTHSTPVNEAREKQFGAVGTMAPAPPSLKTRGGGGGEVAYEDRARPPPPGGSVQAAARGMDWTHGEHTSGYVMMRRGRQSNTNTK